MKQADLKRFQQVIDENEDNWTLATVSAQGKVSSTIITVGQDKEQPNVFYVVTDPESKRAQNIEVHPQVAVSTWYYHKNGDRMSSDNATATVTSDVAKMKEITKPFPELTKYNPSLEGNVVLIITLKSALLESFVGDPEEIEF